MNTTKPLADTLQLAKSKAFQCASAQPESLPVAIGQLLLDEPLPSPSPCVAHFAPESGIARRSGCARRQLAIEPGRRFDSNQIRRGLPHIQDRLALEMLRPIFSKIITHLPVFRDGIVGVVEQQAHDQRRQCLARLRWQRVPPWCRGIPQSRGQENRSSCNVLDL